MNIVSGFLEIIVISASALLIKWGALGAVKKNENVRDKKRMTQICLLLLMSWILFAGIPNFIRSLKNSGELKKFKSTNYGMQKNENSADEGAHLSNHVSGREKPKHARKKHDRSKSRSKSFLKRSRM